MKIADRLKKVLDGGTDPEVCRFQIFGTGGQPKHPTAALLIKSTLHSPEDWQELPIRKI